MIKIDASDLLNNIDKDISLTEKQLVELTAKTTLDVERDLKMATPVDTGRARNGWISTAPTVPYQVGIVENNVEYIGRLNNGHSKQAPKLFVENIVNRYNGGQA